MDDEIIKTEGGLLPLLNGLVQYKFPISQKRLEL
jgi:hypothetical protein